jgi:hypothetical protein
MDQMANRDVDPKRQARLAGLLYLVIILCAGFAQGVVREGLVVAGDAQATADAIRGSMGLWRLGMAADLVAFMSDAGVAVLFYALLRPVGRTLALAAAAFRLLGHPAIASANLLNHFAVTLLLGETSTAGALTPAQLDALSLVAIDLHGAGYLIGGAFFGVSLILLGLLMKRSPRFPDWLAVLLAIAGGAYLLETFTHFVIPALAGVGTIAVVVAASIAEVALCVFLLVRGVRSA